MENNGEISSTFDTTDLIEKLESSLRCAVCGIHGAQYHYGGLCCVSCKMFFRRNSHFDLVSETVF